MALTEASTIQNDLIGVLRGIGFAHVTADRVPRSTSDVLVEPWTKDALRRLNPQLNTDSHLMRAWAHVRAAWATSDDLYQANRCFHNLMVGRSDPIYIPDLPSGQQHFPLRLVDFDDPTNNHWAVVGGILPEHEITFMGSRGRNRRFDVVLYVNGIPLVIVETKGPAALGDGWLQAAREVHTTYQNECLPMFVPNLLSVATDGHQLRVGSVTTPPERWSRWRNDRTEPSSYKRCLDDAAELLEPGTLLDIVRHYTMFYDSPSGGRKVIPRWMQIDAVEKSLRRVEDPDRRQGLVAHFMGSGKTYTMVYTAARLHWEHARFHNPMIIVVIDRLDLLTQTRREFNALGIDIQEIGSRKEVRETLKKGLGGIYVTTVYRFQDQIKALNSSDRVILLIDECHRTQEKALARAMRNALPNATILGYTGTPKSDKQHNTWEAFGDDDDPDRVLSSYSIEQSIADGTTLPLRIIPRYVNERIAQAELDEDFDDMVEDADLEDPDREFLEGAAATWRTLFATPTHLQQVSRDIARHYAERMLEEGLKAQVVVWDRELCVRMHRALTNALEDRHIGSDQVQVAVVMSGHGDKDTPQEWRDHCPDPVQEEELRRRFLDLKDPLRIVIVCQKWLTGFDAPIEGAIYIDRFMSGQTLFQAVCRTNRPYAGAHKTHGTVVDYTNQVYRRLVQALDIQDGNSPLVLDTQQSIAQFELHLDMATKELAFIDRDAADGDQIIQAQRHYHDDDTGRLGELKNHLQVMNSAWEALWPCEQLARYRGQYVWISKMYQALEQDLLQDQRDLWTTYGPRTLEIIGDNISSRVRGRWPDGVLLDEALLQRLRGIPEDETFSSHEGDSAERIMDELQERLQRKLAADDCAPVFHSLAARLEALRRMLIETPEEQQEALQRLVDLCDDFRAAEGADDPSQLLDPRIGSMTQIMQNYGPTQPPDGRAVLESVVYQIDGELRSALTFKRWQSSQHGVKRVRKRIREILLAHDLWHKDDGDELVQRLTEYVERNYVV